MIEIENTPLDKKIDRDKDISVDANILIYFCRNGNIFSIPGWIAASFSEPLHVGNTLNQCKNLCESSILKCEIVHAKGHGGGLKHAYNLNLTVENLKTVVLKIPADDITQLMKTPDYIELLPHVVRYFENALHEQKFKPLNPDVKEIVEHTLKISPSCLKFVLNDKGYKSAAEQQEKIFFRTSRVNLNSISKEVLKDRIFICIFSTFANIDWIMGLVDRDERIYIKLVKLSATDFL